MVGACAQRAGLAHGELAAALAPGATTLQRFRSAAHQDARGVGGDHDLDALADATTTYVNELNATNAKYAPAIDKTQAPFGGAWTHKLRYRAEGHTAEADARAWVTAAEKMFESSVGLMLRDGLVVL